MNRGGGLIAMALFIALISGGGIHRVQGAMEQTSTHVASTRGQSSPPPTWSSEKKATKSKKATSSSQSLATGSGRDSGDKGLTVQAEKLQEALSEATIGKAEQERQEQRDQLQKVLAEIQPNTDLGFMIAIAPDPEKTHLALLFDRYMDAIQMAIQDGGFEYDRAILPWNPQINEETSSATTQETDEHFKDEEDMVPGVLIFRRHQKLPSSNDPTAVKPGPYAHNVKTLVVFVVGETPTSGIERTQFLTALELGQRLTGTQNHLQKKAQQSAKNHEPNPTKSAPKSNLLILGPNFSGSLYSLRELLTPQAGQFAKITIISGEVTGQNSLDEFKAALRGKFSDEINFASFNEKSSALEEALFRYACSDWNMRPSEFAILTETETAFGEELEQGVCPGLPGSERVPLRLSFPRGIYHLRTAYGQQFPDGLPEDSQRPHLRSNLKPNLEEQRTATDSVPDFSSQSPVSQDGVLMGLVDDLQKHRSQLLLVLASDPLDSLFLVRYIRQHYAYGRVVILGPDALLRHESDDPDIRGVLSVSSYSLVHVSGNHLGSSHSAKEVSFPDDSSKASYNAARVLTSCFLNSFEWCNRSLDATAKDETSSLAIPGNIELIGYHDQSFVSYDLSAGSKCCRPDIHLDALGREGFWPVAEFSAPEDSWLPLQQSSTATCANSGMSDPSPSFTLPLSWIALALLGITGLGVLALCFYQSSILSTSEPGVLLAPAPIAQTGDPASTARKNLIGLFCLLACSALTLMLWPMFSPEVDVNADYVLILGAALGVYGAMTFYIWRQFRSRIWGFHLATIIVLAVGFYFRDYPSFRIFLFHSAQVGSEVSPLLPFTMVILSLLWWTWYNISGCALTDLRTPRLPSLAQGLPDIFAPISSEDHHKLRDVMLPGAWDWRVWIPVGATMIVVFLLTIPARPIRTLEPTGYDHLLLFALVVSFILMLESVVRAIVVWMDLKRLLRSLDSQRFVHMIGRIGGFSWSFIWKVGAGSVVKAHCLVLREIDALRKASTLFHARRDELYPDTTMNKVWAIYIALLKQRDKVPDPAIASPGAGPDAKATGSPMSDLDISETGLLLAFSQLQQRLAQAGAQVLEVLTAFYVQPEITCELNEEEAKKLQGHPPETTRGNFEYFACMVYISYIISVLLRIRTLAMAAVGVYVLDVLALNCYPFEPRAILRSLTIGVFAGLTVCFGIVYAQMHYDSILSRVTNTKPGKLDGDFWWRMLTVTGVPLASLLASEFPSIGDFLFSWIEPLTKALR